MRSAVRGLRPEKKERRRVSYAVGASATQSRSLSGCRPRTALPPSGLLQDVPRQILIFDELAEVAVDVFGVDGEVHAVSVGSFVGDCF
jgi:hypothetical protein